jgi:general secretion pathway protein D
MRGRKFGVYFEKVEIEKLVQTVADATCKTFILPENVRGRISIVGPENGRLEVSADEFYATFLSALDANGLAAVPNGRFLKIVDKRSAKQNTIPTIVDPDASYTTNEQMLTKVFKIRYTDAEPLRGILQQMVSKDGDVIAYPPDTLIINDTGANMHRLQKIINQLDSRSSSDEIKTVQIRYAAAQDVATTLQRLFESKGTGRGTRAGTSHPPPMPPGAPGQPPPGGGDSGGGPVTLSQLIPDERTNKLIIVASPAAFDRIQRLINEIDVPISGEGRINVYYLENGNAEDISSTLQALAQGTANRPRQGAAGNPPNVPPQRRGGNNPPSEAGGVQAAELFSGEVKISADKATNSLVIIASQSDYKNLTRVIEKLDIPRRQVFVEAVIMEVNLDRNSEAGINLHQGFSLNGNPGIAGTKYTKSGTPPSFSLASLANMGGVLAGVQSGSTLKVLGLEFPSFGVVLHALQQSSDVNVLSTPHLLTSDNEEAEITVGQNVPFQAGFQPSSLGLATTNPNLTGNNVNNNINNSMLNNPLASLGGLGNLFAPINRQNVELKLTVKPQINESDYIRLVINEQTEEIASQDPVLGPTTSKRSAKTTVVARNQETVVIGGIMQDRTIESVAKVPVLGDIPILGHLFREQTHRRVKTNLLLFLTPYIIKDNSDFRIIFERKMKERQQFVEQFYGQIPGYDVAVDFERKAGPVGRMNQVIQREESKAENGGPGAPGERVIQPTPPASSSPPIEMPRSSSPGDSAPPPEELNPPPPDGGDSAPPPVEVPSDNSNMGDLPPEVPPAPPSNEPQSRLRTPRAKVKVRARQVKGSVRQVKNVKSVPLKTQNKRLKRR